MQPKYCFSSSFIVIYAIRAIFAIVTHAFCSLKLRSYPSLYRLLCAATTLLDKSVLHAFLSVLRKIQRTKLQIENKISVLPSIIASTTNALSIQNLWRIAFLELDIIQRSLVVSRLSVYLELTRRWFYRDRRSFSVVNQAQEAPLNIRYLHSGYYREQIALFCMRLTHRWRDKYIIDAKLHAEGETCKNHWKKSTFEIGSISVLLLLPAVRTIA